MISGNGNMLGGHGLQRRLHWHTPFSIESGHEHSFGAVVDLAANQNGAYTIHMRRDDQVPRNRSLEAERPSWGPELARPHARAVLVNAGWTSRQCASDLRA